MKKVPSLFLEISVLCRFVAFLTTAALLAPQAALAKTMTVGTGSGYVYYTTAQQTLNLEPGDTVYIAAGTYRGISLWNLAGTAEAPITVKCDPAAVFTTDVGYEGNNLINVSFVNFEDFRFINYMSRCLGISGDSHDLLFKNFEFINPGNYIFRILDNAKVFDGTKASTFYNFKWENMVVDGGIGGVITNNDWAAVSNMRSVLLDFEIANCSFSNMTGSALELTKCFNAKIYDCSFNNIGQGGHVSLIYLVGYASIYNNTFTGQWGNDTRAKPAKLNALGYNGPDAVSRFYNNISWEKRKYAVYEHNGISDAEIADSQGYLSRTASEVYFNTLYRSRKVDYIGVLADVLFPNITIKHNLLIEPECDVPFNPARNYVYQITGSLGGIGLVAENNLVFSTFAQSGLVDAESFTPSEASPVLDAATGTVPYIAKDLYGNSRYVGSAADVGAVERQPALFPGDYNGDTVVDLADYTVWADHFGQSGSDIPGDGNEDGTVDLADYTIWADHFGRSAN